MPVLGLENFGRILRDVYAAEPFLSKLRLKLDKVRRSFLMDQHIDRPIPLWNVSVCYPDRREPRCCPRVGWIPVVESI